MNTRMSGTDFTASSSFARALTDRTGPEFASPDLLLPIPSPTRLRLLRTWTHSQLQSFVVLLHPTHGSMCSTGITPVSGFTRTGRAVSHFTGASFPTATTTYSW